MDDLGDAQGDALDTAAVHPSGHEPQCRTRVRRRKRRHDGMARMVVLTGVVGAFVGATVAGLVAWLVADRQIKAQETTAGDKTFAGQSPTSGSLLMPCGTQGMRLASS